MGIHRLLMKDYYVNMHKKYGKTYGKYEGIYPVVVTMDLDLIKSVTIKNADSFQDTFGQSVNINSISISISCDNILHC